MTLFTATVPDYMRNFPDNHPYKELYAKADKFIMCCGQGQWEEELLRSTLQLRDILESKDIHPIVDIWGQMFPTTGIAGKTVGLFPGK